MDTATKNLENDHFHILRLINVMGKITEKTSPSIDHLEKITNLIINYADGFHHAKEETLLFPSMVSKGYSLSQGPLAVMLNDHAQGRMYVKEMVRNIELYKQGNNQVIPVIYENMENYGALLLAHINKENNILFRMADNVLSEQEQKDLLKQFSKIENSQFCGSLLKDHVSSIDELELIYY